MNYRHQRWLLGGGIGSGKSEVRAILSEFGLQTIDADSIGHEILEPEGAAFRQVSRRWPQAVVEGRIDRRGLGAVVFADARELEELEAITHPYIIGTIMSLVEGIDEAVVVELPLLGDAFGSAWRRIVVDAADGLRLERAVARGLSREQAAERMARQPSRAEWLAVADLVVPNNGELVELKDTVAQVRSLISGE